MKRPITDIEELKVLEKNIMKQVHLFCEEKKIRYFLSSGTLIGAVRHKGFIPWDDDIDIYMPRADYDRFCQEFDEWGKSRSLYLVTFDSRNHQYDLEYGKVCDSNTELIEAQFKNKKKIGVYIDIFPLEYIPDHGFAKTWYILRRKVLYRLFKSSILDLNDPSNKELYSPAKYFLIKLTNRLNSETLFDKIKKMEEKYSAVPTGLLMNFESGTYYPSSLFEERILWPFEDEKFYIPKEYDKVLKIAYGDYMTLPPVEEQQPHHIQDVWRIEKND